MKIGIVLSGGGARGVAHLGVLKALNEKNITISQISGSSAGALVGALYAAGYSPDEIMAIILNEGIRKHLKIAFNKLGLFSMKSVEQLLIGLIPHNSFEDLKIPLSVCTTAIETSKEVYFSTGELAKPVLASCCIPGIFEPINFQNQLLIDGGVVNNLPIEPLLPNCNFVIGVNVLPMSGKMRMKSAKDILIKSLYISISKSSSEKLKSCDIAIEPKRLIGYDGLSLVKANDMFQIGYEKTLAILEENKLKLTHFENFNTIDLS